MAAPGDLLIWAELISLYLSSMAFALYPGRAVRVAPSAEEAAAFEPA